jgi:hypothetical protein
VLVSRRSFLLMVHEFRHMMLMKRAGRFMVAGGVSGTALGELALKCRCCPWPGFNPPPTMHGIDPKTW